MNPDDGQVNARRLRACLGAMAAYLTLVLVLLLALAALGLLGVELAPIQVRALRIAVTAHLAGLATVGGLLWSFREGRSVSIRASRVALAAMPFVLIASLDRLASISFPPISGPGLIAAHPTRGWTNRPDWSERVGRRIIRINTDGFRGAEVPREKPPGEWRIVILGDSLAFGLGVDEHEIFVGRLSDMAAQAGLRIRFINCSVSGYAPWQQLDLLASECLKFTPDVVVHIFCLNDVIAVFEHERFGGPTRGIAPVPPTPLDWSGLFQMFRSTVANRLSGVEQELQRIRNIYSVERMIDEPEAPEIREAWSIVLRDMTRMHAICQANSVRFAMVVFPYADQISPFAPETSPPQQTLAAFAQDRQIPFLDLLPAFRPLCLREEVIRNTAPRWEGLAIMPDRVHPIPEGHDVAAREMFDFFQREGLLGGNESLQDGANDSPAP